MKANHHNSSEVSTYVEKRQFSTHAATNKKVKSVVSTFRETVIRLLLYNKFPQAHLGGIATAIILNLILPKGRTLSVWEQVEEQVQNMVHDKLNDNNIAHLRDDWNIIGEALQNSPRSLTAAKINRVLALSPNFMPHNYPSSKWSVKWPMTMMGYLASLKAMYIDLSGKLGGGIEGCAWVNLMKHFSVEVWRAARLLARDRWRRFEGIDWHGGVTHFYPDGRYTYKDGATGEYWRRYKVNHVKSSVIGATSNRIAAYLFEHFGKRFNALNTVVQEATWPYKVKKQGSRCTGTNDDEAWRGKVKSAAVCAAVCQGTAKYFSFGKADKPLNRACSADSGLHECDCYCEESLQCTTMDDANFDVYEFEDKTKRVEGKVDLEIEKFADYKLITQESECTGGETYKGFKSSHAECANACRDKSQMFIYAINKNDKTKCDNGKCKCFCELGTHNYKCNSRKKNKDWALFAFVVDYAHIAEKTECIGGEEKFKGRFKHVGECAAACRGEAEMFIFGTNKYGRDNCWDGTCNCYCEYNTKDFKCKDTIQHNGFNLYAFEDYNLVAESHECSGGTETYIGYKQGVHACAEACRGTSEMFVYGRGSKCAQGSCGCWCEHNTADGNCKNRVRNTGFDLYTYSTADSPCFFRDQKYQGSNMNGGCSKADNVGNCQMLCRQTVGCVKFSYFKTNKNCCLKSDSASKLIDEIGATSGPKDCDDANLHCTTKNEPCVFPFVYKGVTYTQCTATDRDTLWCSTINKPNGEMRTWGECSRQKSCVDKCVPGPNFKLSDFKWELPKSCYGSCMAPNGNHEAFFWCDLPCLFYDGRSNPRECLIRGYYKDPHLIFAGRADCSDCTKADWENCWRTYPPSRIFG